VLLGLERMHDLFGGRSAARRQPESVGAAAFLARLKLG
jgi:hypothetical protein